MCGYIFLHNFSTKISASEKKIFQKLKKINKHRGPDKVNLLQIENSLMIFRKLSITDFSRKSDQPYIFKRKNRNFIMLFNGEIYNYKILKDILKKKYNFTTSSDTELAAKAFDNWGLDFLKKIDGMYSFIIKDISNQKIYFCRDILGQKPLYYFKNKTKIIASSEIKDIIFYLKKKNIQIKENKNTIRKYFYRGWVDDDEKTFFQNIYKFKPGRICVYSYKKKLSEKKFFTLNLNKKKKYSQLKFNKILKKNINDHFTSKVRTAVTLSGGIDSSSIMYVLKDKPVKFFNISSNAEELMAINRLKGKEGIKLCFVNTKKNFNKNNFKSFIKAQDEPVNCPSFFNKFLLNKELFNQKYRISINGEGADEIFFGYLRSIILLLKKENINHNKMKNLKKIYEAENIKKNIHKISLYKKKGHDIEDTEHLIFANTKTIPRQLRYNFKNYLDKKKNFTDILKTHLYRRDLPHILRADDKACMHFSIENRNPFISKTIIEEFLSFDNLDTFKNGEIKKPLVKFLEKISRKKYNLIKKQKRPKHLDSFFNKEISKDFIKKINETESIPFFNKDKILRYFNKEKVDDLTDHKMFFFRIYNYLTWRQIFLIN
tara:strand:+ start:3220 stop:5025 length:1806 start_codon:yes stop_codon:yes gene_type:complete